MIEIFLVQERSSTKKEGKMIHLLKLQNLMPKLMIYCDDFTIRALTNVVKDRCIQAQFGLEIQCTA